MVLGDLQADTGYSVSVGAYTAKGDGARSKPVTVCTAMPRKCVHTKTESNTRKHTSLFKITCTASFQFHGNLSGYFCVMLLTNRQTHSR